MHLLTVLTAREARIRENDLAIAELKHLIVERIAEQRGGISATDHQEMGALDEDITRLGARVEWMKRAKEGLNLRCECGGPTCEAWINVTGRDLDYSRRYPPMFLCARGHDVVGIDQPSATMRSETDPETDYLVARPRSGWDALST